VKFGLVQENFDYIDVILLACKKCGMLDYYVVEVVDIQGIVCPKCVCVDNIIRSDFRLYNGQKGFSLSIWYDCGKTFPLRFSKPNTATSPAAPRPFFPTEPFRSNLHLPQLHPTSHSRKTSLL
jgi:hypothetical protein